MNTYIQYKDTKYIILSDGKVARLLKPTKVHKQEYYNLIINGKQDRRNANEVKELYQQLSSANASAQEANEGA